MKNKSRFLSICTLVLCAALLGFGIYALKNASLTVGGTIGFTAHDCNILVYGKITGAVTDADDLSGDEQELYLVNYADSGDFSKTAAFDFTGTKELTFENDLYSYDEASTTAEHAPIIYFNDSGDAAPDIVITLYLKNNSAYPVSVDVQSVSHPDGVTYTTSGATYLDIDAENFSELVITLTLEDNSTEIKTSSENFGLEIYFEKTAEAFYTPTNIAVDGESNTLSFDAVPSATSYELAYYKAGETDSAPVHTQTVTSNSNIKFDFSPSEEGNYAIKVRAIKQKSGADAKYTDYTEAKVVSFYTPTPANLFTFTGNSVTGYTGSSLTQIVIPRSYSLDASGAPIDGEDIKVDSIASPGGSNTGFTGKFNTLILLNNIKEIKSFSLNNCSSIKSITIPETIVSLNYCFSNTSINQVNYTGNINQWCNIDFVDLQGLPFNGFTLSAAASSSFTTSLYVNGSELVEEITLDGLTEIKQYTFGLCTSLKKVTIAEGVQEIGDCAFGGCINLNSVTLPHSLTKCYGTSFVVCRQLAQVHYNGTVAEWCNIEIPTVSGTIANYFGNRNLLCYGAKLYDATNNLVTQADFTGFTEIKARVFDGYTSLKSIILPKEVTLIGDYAFNGCTALTKIYYTGNEEEFTTLLNSKGSNNSSITANKAYYQVADAAEAETAGYNCWYYENGEIVEKAAA